MRESLKRPFHIVPTWSTLRTLGQSRLVALTALIPFLGTLIIFNQQLVDLLLISPELISYWLGSEQLAEGAARDFTLSRLQLTYFGLVALGIGSFLFAILCPPDLKRQATITEYIEAEKPLITRARTGLLVTDVAWDFLRNQGEEEARGPKYLRELAYPDSQMALFYSVFAEITENMEWDDDDDEPPDAEAVDAKTTGDYLVELGIYTGGGNVDAESVARLLYNRIRVHRAFWLTFYVTAEKYLTDLLALRFYALDHSKPFFRIAVAASYCVGFATLFFPTATTFILILRAATGL